MNYRNVKNVSPNMRTMGKNQIYHNSVCVWVCVCGGGGGGYNYTGSL